MKKLTEINDINEKNVTLFNNYFDIQYKNNDSPILRIEPNEINLNGTINVLHPVNKKKIDLLKWILKINLGSTASVKIVNKYKDVINDKLKNIENSYIKYEELLDSWTADNNIKIKTIENNYEKISENILNINRKLNTENNSNKIIKLETIIENIDNKYIQLKDNIDEIIISKCDNIIYDKMNNYNLNFNVVEKKMNLLNETQVKNFNKNKTESIFLNNNISNMGKKIMELEDKLKDQNKIIIELKYDILKCQKDNTDYVNKLLSYESDIKNLIDKNNKQETKFTYKIDNLSNENNKVIKFVNSLRTEINDKLTQ